MSELTIHKDDGGQRLDRFLRKLLPGATLAHVFKLLRQGRVRVNGTKATGKHRLAEGDRVAIGVDDAVWDQLRGRPGQHRGAARPLELVYADEHIVIVDKPAMVPVHGGSGLGDDHIAGRLLAQLGPAESLTFQPAPVHRLDRETSGVLVCGRTAEGSRALSQLFRSREVEKRYVALVESCPDPRSGVIDVPLSRRQHAARDEPKVVVDREAGKPARSRYRVVREWRATALVEVELETGRTHQIRAHLAWLGHPIVGDARYGGRHVRGGRIFLHASRVAFVHPLTGREVVAESPVPEEFEQLARR